MWHQKDEIGKMYNIIEDNVTRRSTHDTRNVTTKYKLIDDQQWHSKGTVKINNGTAGLKFIREPIKLIVTDHSNS